MRARLALLAGLMAACLFASPTLAADDGARDAARAAISRQAEALARDDAETAYAQASPAIRDLFPTPEVFIGMVRTNYRPVYRHRSFVFGQAQDRGETGLSQEVAIQDEYGVDWTADYTVERQPDGSWRITGCRLTKAPGTNT
ncbi:DUF4864 domain-containing protein [Methylobacterium dankookense]|uniref:DUF4864 domain-containing protein n=1 Tax=Methylobacterium dankookense TaxID=560405 RepID=A0A564G0P4_9HYPH|nr:DUF4864 domain-containing protein [Methylobacterium dankookense]GJD54606.1 hypothetical protein IFDJLNFL_0481 [Methylobacterium dankookense]VUF13518.1 hypothetical protein MTDSW087_03223 [Methylobacterium dankookense]